MFHLPSLSNHTRDVHAHTQADVFNIFALSPMSILSCQSPGKFNLPVSLTTPRSEMQMAHVAYSQVRIRP